MNLSCWLSLETLIIPQENFNYEIKDLGRLTTLTSLKCDSSVFVDIDELFALKNLTSLCITSLSIYAEPVDSFPLLTYLESDFIGHFTGFTGKGILEGDDRQDVEDGEDRDFFNEKNDLFQKGGWNICLYGEWECGLFTGKANIQYTILGEEEEVIMYGQMVKGKYDGPQIEEIRIESKEIYRGGFKCGLKDGLATVYTWPGEMYWSENKLIPQALQYWSIGEKLDEFFFS